jgi:hypothetical protein
MLLNRKRTGDGCVREFSQVDSGVVVVAVEFADNPTLFDDAELVLKKVGIGNGVIRYQTWGIN